MIFNQTIIKFHLLKKEELKNVEEKIQRRFKNTSLDEINNNQENLITMNKNENTKKQNKTVKDTNSNNKI